MAKVDLDRLIQTTLPQEIASSIFHWHNIPAAEWKSLLIEIHLVRKHITVNCSSDSILLKFQLYEDGELFAGEYRRLVTGEYKSIDQEWTLEQTVPVSNEYILFTILKEYLL